MNTVSVKPEANKAEYELSITRVFDAPRELVWKAWVDPEMLSFPKGICFCSLGPTNTGCPRSRFWDLGFHNS
jgi:hypothetical protein